MKRQLELMMITEKVVNEGLKMALRERDASRGIELFIRHLGEKSNSERIYIFEGLRDMPVCNTFEWCAEGVTQEKENLQNVPFEAVKWWYDIFETKNCVIIKDLEEIRESAAMTYEYLKPQNIHSLITAPLWLENEIIGFFGVDNPPTELVTHISEIAEMVAHFIVSLLEKQRLMHMLEKLSFEDSLCGVKNRHALHADITYYKNVCNTGILYCDVLGLKKVNDTLGHQAGDALLCRAGKCLQELFCKNEIYRIGGDEFLVICKNVEEAVFLEKTERVRENMLKYDARMSMGVVWKEWIENMDAAIAQADQLMYEEKRMYYAVHKR